MKGKQKILFLFTKEFPYGQREQYIAEELPFLAAEFDAVKIMPTEYFGGNAQTRALPANFEIIDLNKKSASTTEANKYGKGGILFSEFLHEKNKKRYLIEFSRYRAILNHQCLLASVFEKELEPYKEDQVFFYSYWLHNSCIMLGLLKKAGVINSYISRAHSIDLYHNDWPLAYEKGVKVLPFQYFKNLTCDAIYSISHAGELYSKKKYPQLAEKFHTAYLGVQDLGESVFKSDSVFTIVSCSGLSPNKRVNRIASIFIKLGFPARWIHFGDGEEMNQIKETLKGLPEGMSVELKGHTSNQEVLQFYKGNSVNLFINLSRVEGIPVSIMESMSFGIPALGTRVFGTPEVIAENCGFLVNEDFTDTEVIGIIREFAKDPIKQTAFRKAARVHCMAHFNLKKNIPSFITELKKRNNN